jgi:hypothetical protein
MSFFQTGCSGCTGTIGVDQKTLCIRTPGDMNTLLKTFRRYDSIRIIHPTLPSEERQVWERRLADTYTACGCEIGAIGFIAAVGLAFARGIASPHPFTWRNVAFAGASCFALAIAGKIVGIVYARIRLWHLVRNLQGRLAQDSK